MTDILFALLVSSVSALGGGVAGALVAAVCLRGEQARFDNRVGDIRSQVEDLETRWLTWQRRANKRRRDASGDTESDEQRLRGMSQSDMGRELLRRARANGILR